MKLQKRHLNESFIGKIAGFAEEDGIMQYGIIRQFNSIKVWIDLVNDNVGVPVPISNVDFILNNIPHK